VPGVRRPPTGRVLLGLRAVASLALAASAYLHATLASGPLVAGGEVTVAGLFVGQAVIAGLAALWVLLHGSRLAWVLGAAVALGSLAALVVSTYVRLPGPGPLPVVYDPFWYGEKVAAALAAALGGAAAVAALALGTSSDRERTR
jgi:hypothetical protein